MELFRTPEVETIARELMQQLAASPQQLPTGNLYGVLLAQTAAGEQKILQGFSGLSNGQGRVPGWVPPLTVKAQMALIEPQVLATLHQLKTKIISLSQLPEWSQHRELSQKYTHRLNQLALRHRQRKQERDRSRAHYKNTLQGDGLTQALQILNQASQNDSFAYRQLKKAHHQTLAPLVTKITQAEQTIKQLKQRYIELSKRWQRQMQIAYETERLGEDLELDLTAWADYLGDASTCQRAAAKLLHYAANYRLQPLALAEFWWGPPQGEFYPGQFYSVSAEDSELLIKIAKMPPRKPSLSATATATTPLSILYQDEALIVVDKPAGMLSVPGRRYHLQDSVLSRLRRQLPKSAFVQVVHRLDQATSGILVLALSPSVHADLSQQFAQGRVYKIYEAVLTRPIMADSGAIHLPLWGNPAERPKQSVNRERGKPSVTQFELIQTGPQPRIKFMPQTGRTHQLRVHAAHPQGLYSPIKGDRLYGQPSKAAERLHLHATSLKLTHPVTQEPLLFVSDVPF